MTGPADAALAHLDPDSYFLTAGYRQRTTVEYFADDADDGITWQPDVYPHAAVLATELGRDVLIDIGCGRAGKLAGLAADRPDRRYVGVDYGPNIAWCRDNLPFGDWLEADLERCTELPLDPALVRRSVVICSDVLEHMLKPEVLAGLIRNLLVAGAGAAVLSTPARELRAGADDPGPPRNPSHVREWTSEEFQAFLRHAGFHLEHAGLTRSDDAGGGQTTQLAVVTAASADR